MSRDNQLLVGHYGTIYRLDPTTGDILRQIDVTSPVSTGGDYETQLSTSDGQVLFVGVHGSAYALSLHPLLQRRLVGEAWHWVNQEAPEGVNLGTPVGMTSATLVSTPPQNWPSVSLIGADGNVWPLSNGGLFSFEWQNQGKPPGVDHISAPVGVVTDPVLKTTYLQFPLVFVQGSDGTVWYAILKDHDSSTTWLQLQGTGTGGPGRLGKPLGVLPASSNKIAFFGLDEAAKWLWWGKGTAGGNDWTWESTPGFGVSEPYGVFARWDAPSDSL